MNHKKCVFLTNAVGIVQVLHGLCVGLQLCAVIADINPLIFHYLLVRKEKEREALTNTAAHNELRNLL